MAQTAGARSLGSLTRGGSNAPLKRQAYSSQWRPRAPRTAATRHLPRASVETDMLSALLGATVKRQQKDVSDLVQAAGAKDPPRRGALCAVPQQSPL